MQKYPFSFIAIALGLMLLTLLTASAPDTVGGEPRIPLLAILIASEFGFVVTAIGVFTGIKTMLSTGKNRYIIVAVFCCALMSVKFMLTGISYWPGLSS